MDKTPIRVPSYQMATIKLQKLLSAQRELGRPKHANLCDVSNKGPQLLDGLS